MPDDLSVKLGEIEGLTRDAWRRGDILSAQLADALAVLDARTQELRAMRARCETLDAEVAHLRRHRDRARHAEPEILGIASTY